MGASITWTVMAGAFGVLAGAIPAAMMRLRVDGGAQAQARADWAPLLLPRWAWTVLGGVIGVLLAVRFAHAAVLPAYLAFAACTIPICAIDLANSRIPDKILGPAAAVTTLCLAVTSLAGDGDVPLIRSVLGALAVGGGFFALAILAGGGFGLGDVKLLAFLASMTGYQSWSSLLHGLFAGFVIAAAIALVTRRFRDSRHLPLAPWLITGTVIVLLL